MNLQQIIHIYDLQRYEILHKSRSRYNSNIQYLLLSIWYFEKKYQRLFHARVIKETKILAEIKECNPGTKTRFEKKTKNNKVYKLTKIIHTK